MRFLNVVYFFLSTVMLTYAQNQNNNWYFGEFAGITFNTNPPSALTDGELDTFEGCASISDASGNLLFYTDGSDVYNRNHVLMSNGTGLMGSWSSTQSAIIVPMPGSVSLYYIFTLAKEAESNGFRYSVVDLSLNGGLGDVTAQKNVLIRTPVVEKVVAVKHDNGNDVWIVCHGWNNNEFYAYLLTSAGLSSTPVISAVGTVHDTNGGLNTDNWVGYMRVSPDRTKIALAVRQKSLYEVFEFNASSGVLYNPISLYNVQSTTNFAYGAYGLEFSPNSQYLYVKNLGPGDVFQYDLSTYDATSITASKTYVGNIAGGGNYQTGAMQLGPDGKIYIVKFALSTLGVINNPDQQGTACNLVDNAISLSGRYGQLGLPSFVSTNFFNNPVITSSFSGCYNGIYHFYLSDSTSITGVAWNFDDPASGVSNTSVLFSPTHLFSAPGNYHVSAIVSYATGPDDTAYVDVIVSNPPDVILQDSAFACTGSSWTAEAVGVWSQYQWSSASTASSIQISQPGLYSVTVTDASGCTVEDDVYVSFGDTTLTILDTSFCEGTSVLIEGQIITASGTYTFNYQTSSGCDSIVRVNAISVPIPYVSLPGDTTICIGESLSLYPFVSGLYSQFEWNDGFLSLGRTITTEGHYSLTVENECGTNSDEIFVLFDSCLSEIWFPNVFTPNGDWHNPVFKGEGINILSFHILIFNRWGQLVYEGNAFEEGWDGTFRGVECAQGVYFWVANYSLYRNAVEVEEFSKGSVTLLR